MPKNLPSPWSNRGGEFDEVQQDTAVVEDAHDDSDHVDEGDLTHSSSVEADERSNKEN